MWSFNLVTSNNRKGDMMLDTKQGVLNELARLYRLQAEGKKVKSLIAQYEELLSRLIDDEINSEKDNEEKIGGSNGRRKRFKIT